MGIVKSLFIWWHHISVPHCEHCRQEELEKISENFCKSCEILKEQLALANLEKKQLLDRLLEKPEVKEVIMAPAPNITVPRTLPWNVRRQMMEHEDREKARLMKDAPKPIETVSTEKLEEEILNAGHKS